MVQTIDDDCRRNLHQQPHPAILLTVDATVSPAEAGSICKAVEACLDVSPQADETRPVWIRFMDVDTCEIHMALSRSAPCARDFLTGLVAAAPRIRKFTLIEAFDFRARQWRKKLVKPMSNATSTASVRSRVSPSVDGKHDGHVPQGIPDPNRLPLKLRFLACEDAMREARALGEVYDRWPFWNFTVEDMRHWSEKLVDGFSERYPLLAQADRAMNGKMTQVVAALGRHPHAALWERKRFWGTVRRGGVMSWERFAEQLLAAIDGDKGGDGGSHCAIDPELTDATSQNSVGGEPRARLTSKRQDATPAVPLSRPPSVSVQHWQAVPVERRREAVEFAALNLRRGIHPEDSFEIFSERCSGLETITPPIGQN